VFHFLGVNTNDSFQNTSI